MKTTTQPAPSDARTLNLANILVPIDFTKTSSNALWYAKPFARSFDARITLVHAIDTLAYAASMRYVPVNGELLMAPAERRLEALGIDAVGEELLGDILVRAGTPFEVITNVAREWDVDLIVIGTHGYSGIRHFFQGSTTERVVREAPCPVLVVHPTEHEVVQHEC